MLDTTAKAKVLLCDEEYNALREQRKAEHKRGRCPKYREVEVTAKLHVTYDRKRAQKDFADRQRALEKLEKRVAGGMVTSSLRYGCNKYLNSEVTDGKGAYIDKARIDADAAWDGYYAIVTDRQDLSTEDVSRMYRDQWKIEESFRILKRGACKIVCVNGKCYCKEGDTADDQEKHKGKGCHRPDCS